MTNLSWPALAGAALLSGTIVIATGHATSAGPVPTSTAAVKQALTSDVVTARHRGNTGAFVGGLVVGGILGAAIAGRHYYDGPYYYPYAYYDYPYGYPAYAPYNYGYPVYVYPRVYRHRARSHR